MSQKSPWCAQEEVLGVKICLWKLFFTIFQSFVKKGERVGSKIPFFDEYHLSQIKTIWEFWDKNVRTTKTKFSTHHFIACNFLLFSFLQKRKQTRKLNLPFYCNFIDYWTNFCFHFFSYFLIFVSSLIHSFLK